MKSIKSLSRFSLLVTVVLYLSVAQAEPTSYGSLPNRIKTYSTPLAFDSMMMQKIKPIAEFAASLRNRSGVLLKFKERKHLLKEQLQAIRQSPDKTKNQKTLLTILAILAFIGIFAILYVIGYNGGAGLWPVVGLGIAIFLLLFFLKRIRRSGKK